VIRVLLADDQVLVRAGFRALLDAQDDLEVIGGCARYGRCCRATPCSPQGVTRRLIAEFAARSKEPAAAAGLERLTDREHEVVTLVGIGLSNEEIAR
jgi:DNA-binding NarL/FixJ family response regulator